jgi:hypothetical protein
VLFSFRYCKKSAFTSHPSHATFPILYKITLITLGEEHKLCSSPLCSFLQFSVSSSWVQIFSWTLSIYVLSTRLYHPPQCTRDRSRKDLMPASGESNKFINQQKQWWRLLVCTPADRSTFRSDIVHVTKSGLWISNVIFRRALLRGWYFQFETAAPVRPGKWCSLKQ